MADMKEVERDLIAKAGASLGVVVEEDVAGKPTALSFVLWRGT